MRAFKITNTITRRDEQSMVKYLNEISRYDVLTPEEELALFQAYKSGDKNALEKIVTHNLRFVVSVAKQYQNLGFWLGDLVNEGNIGLIKAAERFDETKGFKFISYAVWWIRQSILQAINEKGRSIKVPVNVTGDTSKVVSKISELLQSEEREPTIGELAEATGLSERKIERSLKTLKRPRSLDAPVNTDSETSLAYLVEDEIVVQPDYDLTVTQSQQVEIRQLLNTLNERQSTVIKFYYGIGQSNHMTLTDIGKVMGITRNLARQIKDRGLAKLKHNIKSRKLTFALS
jgi:RNA polymerase primary sigma factor